MKRYMVILLLLFFIVSCSAEKSSNMGLPGGVEEKKSEALRDDQKSKKLNFNGVSGKNYRRITEHFVLPENKSLGRYLEYNVDLSYTTEEFYQSRRHLMDTVQQHGFLNHSYTNVKGVHPTLQASFRVKKEDLFDAIKACDNLGRLNEERINVTDHTGKVIYTNIRIERESRRSTLKKGAQKGNRPGGKNWKELQESRESNEDSLDSEKFNKWKMIDKVNWPVINLTIRGPRMSEEETRVEVPLFRNAFAAAVNYFLQALYGFIVILPFALPLLLVLLYRRRIIRFFKDTLGKNNKK
jgi:hypothetical protein